MEAGSAFITIFNTLVVLFPTYRELQTHFLELVMR